MTKQVRIVAISGSSRVGSTNTQLLRSIAKMAPKNVDIEILSGLEKLPFYSEDLESHNLPTEIVALREKVSAADAVLIATPEYNYSYTGLVKNTIDWLSRPYAKGVLAGKPVAITGASLGAFGTVRAQAHLRQVLHGTNSKVVNRPEVYVGSAHEKFGEDDDFLDASGRTMLLELLDNLIDLAADVNGSEMLAS